MVNLATVVFFAYVSPLKEYIGATVVVWRSPGGTPEHSQGPGDRHSQKFFFQEILGKDVSYMKWPLEVQ